MTGSDVTGIQTHDHESQVHQPNHYTTEPPILTCAKCKQSPVCEYLCFWMLLMSLWLERPCSSCANDARLLNACHTFHLVGRWEQCSMNGWYISRSSVTFHGPRLGFNLQHQTNYSKYNIEAELHYHGFICHLTHNTSSPQAIYCTRTDNHQKQTNNTQAPKTWNPQNTKISPC